MTDPSILFVKPKAISRADKAALKGAGVIVVEVEDPMAVKLVKANAELSGSDLLLAASHAINNTGFGPVKEAFAKAICEAIRARMSKPS